MTRWFRPCSKLEILLLWTNLPIANLQYFIFKFISFRSSLKVPSKYAIILGNITWKRIFIIVRRKCDATMHAFLYLLWESFHLIDQYANVLACAEHKVEIFHRQLYARGPLLYKRDYECLRINKNISVIGQRVERSKRSKESHPANIQQFMHNY